MRWRAEEGAHSGGAGRRARQQARPAQAGVDEPRRCAPLPQRFGSAAESNDS